MEEWKDIKGYEGLYQVSNLGRIKSLLFGRELIRKPCIDGWGYAMVGLYKKGVKMRMRKIHRIVMSEFVGDSILDVNHKNGIKTDNRLENLEYCTQSENTIHLYRVLGHKAPSGERHHKAKLTKEQIYQIKNDKRTLKRIAQDYNCHYTTIHYIKSGRNRLYD